MITLPTSPPLEKLRETIRSIITYCERFPAALVRWDWLVFSGAAFGELKTLEYKIAQYDFVMQFVGRKSLCSSPSVWNIVVIFVIIYPSKMKPVKGFDKFWTYFLSPGLGSTTLLCQSTLWRPARSKSSVRPRCRSNRNSLTQVILGSKKMTKSNLSSIHLPDMGWLLGAYRARGRLGKKIKWDTLPFPSALG